MWLNEVLFSASEGSGMKYVRVGSVYLFFLLFLFHELLSALL